MAAWAARDGCDPSPPTCACPTRSSGAPGRVATTTPRSFCTWWRAGPQLAGHPTGGDDGEVGGEVGGEDRTADPAAGGLASVAGHTTQDISAAELAWEFFQRHQLQP